MDDRLVLLTGVTGFLGREVLFELMTRTGAQVVCMVRASGDGEARERVREIWERHCGAGSWELIASRVDAVAGDLTRSGLGLSTETRGTLVRNVTHIVHGAATVRFDQPLADARRTNGGGTMAMLHLANACARWGLLQRFCYISTAFVAGTYRDWFREADLDLRQRFHNTYERTKFEAELLVRVASPHLPVTVVRPSIVIGHSRTGATTAFNTVYWPLRMYAKGLWRVTSVRPDTLVDVVPVDHVARGVVEAVLGAGEPGMTYTLAAGRRAPTAEEIGELAAETFGTPPPLMVSTPADRVLLPLAARAMVGPLSKFGRSFRQYVPYFLGMPRFDTANADALLHPRGIVAPPAATFLRPVLEFAIDTDFGQDTASVERRQAEITAMRQRELRTALSDGGSLPRRRSGAGAAVRRRAAGVPAGVGAR